MNAPGLAVPTGTTLRTATPFTRLTVLGAGHRCELVVPSDEPLAALLPRLLDLLQEPVGAPGSTVPVRITGEQLRLDHSLAEQQVLDGEVIRLVRHDHAPPPPEVADVTDVVVDSFAGRRDRWDDDAREWAGTVSLAVVGAAASAQLAPAGPPAASIGILAMTLASAVLAGLLGPTRDGWISTALTGLAVGFAAATAVRLGLADSPAGLGWLLPTATAAGLLVWPCLGLGLGLARRRIPILAGSVVGLAVAGIPLGLSGLGPDRASAVTAAVSTIVLGVLPRYAAMVSGLTGLDDSVLAGNPLTRDRVHRGVETAYASLTWSAVGAAAGIAVTAGVLLGSADPWSVAIGAVVVAATALRTRSFPLVGQQFALWAAVLAAVTTGLVIHAWPGLGAGSYLGPVVVAGLAGLIVAGVCVRPAAHLRASLRRTGNVAESTCVVAIIPLAFGQFGVYTELLGLFR